MVPAISGKIELETVEDSREDQIIEKLIAGATVTVFNRNFNIGELEEVVARFKSGLTLDVSDVMPSPDYVTLARSIDGLQRAVKKLDAEGDAALTACAVEFILEGLHLNKRLNKDRVAGRVQYRG
jgi:magnesium chelatase subunit I